MFNPLNRRIIHKSTLQYKEGSKASKHEEDENEIYCVICKNKYSIEGYKSHMNMHRREIK